MIIVFLSYIDAKFIRINDFHETGSLIAVVILLMDYISDILFALHLLCYDDNDMLYISGLVCIFFIIFPLIISLIQLHLQFKDWQRFDDINAYISDNAYMLYGLSLLLGSAFTAISLCHSRLFDIYKLDIPLNKMQLLNFRNKRIYSVVFFENIPQILVQIGYIISISENGSIVYATMTFSVLSVFLTVLSIRTYKNLEESRDYVQMAVDVKGKVIYDKISKCKNRIYLLRKQLSGLFGVSIKSIEVQRPTQIPNGLRVSMNIYINNTKSIDINCNKLLAEAIKSGQVGQIFKECWDLSAVPTVDNQKYKKHESKLRKENTVKIKHESEMIGLDIPDSLLNGNGNNSVIVHEVDGAVNNSDLPIMPKIPPPVKVVSASMTDMGGLDSGNNTDDSLDNIENNAGAMLNKQNQGNESNMSDELNSSLYNKVSTKK